MTSSVPAALFCTNDVLPRLREVPINERFPLFESVPTGVPEVPRNWYEVKVEAECERMTVELLWVSWALARFREVPIKDRFPLFDKMATAVPEVPRNWYEVKVEAECERVMVELLWASWALARLREVPTKERFPMLDKVPTVVPDVPRKRKPLVKVEEESETSRVLPDVFCTKEVLPSWRDVPIKDTLPTLETVATGVPVVERKRNPLESEETSRVLAETFWTRDVLPSWRDVPTKDKFPVLVKRAAGVPEVARKRKAVAVALVGSAKSMLVMVVLWLMLTSRMPTVVPRV